MYYDTLLAGKSDNEEENIAEYEFQVAHNEKMRLRKEIIKHSILALAGFLSLVSSIVWIFYFGTLGALFLPGIFLLGLSIMLLVSAIKKYGPAKKDYEEKKEKYEKAKINTERLKW